ncbi:MAG: response regulator, partial [Synergistaceae bacterium]|nr:response regulator [Synergistaceae bacterium]
MDWVVIVDDDIVNLKMAGTILSKNGGMRVTGLKSGQALLDFLAKLENKEVPDLCLLDIKMPLMNGFEALKKLRTMENGKELPVIFLTADDSGEAETRGLSLGAMDFIKKPFVPEVLTLRVRHSIDLVRLQKNLAQEVARKTEENYKLFRHVILALATAIDAKDIYTNGHSERVAQYSKEIARRYGYNEQQQNDIYVMGLLHDVGKIGIPDSIIKKSDKLTDEEYEFI